MPGLLNLSTKYDKNSEFIPYDYAYLLVKSLFNLLLQLQLELLQGF